MNWKMRLFLLAVISFPALTGYPLSRFGTELLPGASYGWIAYFSLSGIAVCLLTGTATFSIMISIAAMICLPVVFAGSTVSCLALLVTGEGTQAAYSAHYLSLCLTMLTVIPLALSIVAVVPFTGLEQALLKKTTGVSLREKIGLMALRVFTHILYFVIPDILEVMQEENFFTGWRGLGGETLRHRLVSMTKAMIFIGVEAICSGIRFIPLWAEEIARLPGKDKPSVVCHAERQKLRTKVAEAGLSAQKQKKQKKGLVHVRHI